MRLRQIALVGKDLDAAKHEIEAVLGLGNPFADKGVGKFGLANAVWPVGDTFLEVVSPRQEGTTAGRLLDKRGGDGGYMTIFQVEDIEAARARVAAQGVRVVEQADFDGVAMTHLHPKDVGGAIVSIDQMTPKERWEWGGPGWQEHVRTDVSLGIVGAELQAEDPAAMSARWADVLGLERQETAGGWRLPLEGGELRFTKASDGRGDGLAAFDVKVRDPGDVRGRAHGMDCMKDGEVVLCGTRVCLVSA
jgi:catechol 2,3-dioxygenase-like lactoylglutathione lyase family enzyme